MHKLILLFCGLCMMACNNQQATTPASETATTASTPAGTKVLSKETELEIIGSCVDNAKANLGEAKAYALCKCILNQVQEKYPTADSTAIVDHLADSAEVAQMAPNCK